MKQELIQCALTHGRRFVRYGKPASYIPELASKDPSKLGIAVCDMEGNVITAGDCKEKFSMQSISKVIWSRMALTMCSARWASSPPATPSTRWSGWTI